MQTRPAASSIGSAHVDARLPAGSRRPARDLGAGRARVPPLLHRWARAGLRARRLPRRRGVLRRQRLPDHRRCCSPSAARRAASRCSGSGCGARAGCCPRCSCCSRSSSLYALLFLPDSIGTLKSDTLAALTYTSNWWQVISHQSYIVGGRPARAAEAPVVARDRGAVLPAVAAAADARAAQARPPAHARDDVGVALASTMLMAHRRDRQHQRRVLLAPTRGCRDCCSVPRWRSSSRRTKSAGSPDAACALALDVAGVARPVRAARGRSHHFTRSRSCRAATSSVFRGGFLLVDLATLLVIAAVGAPALRRRARSSAAQPLRWIGLRSYSLYLWHYPIFCVTRPGLDVPLHGWPARDAAPRPVVRRGRALVPLRRDADPQRRDRPLPRAHAHRARRPARAAHPAARSWASARSLIVVVGLGASLAARTGTVEVIPGAAEGARGRRRADADAHGPRPDPPAAAPHDDGPHRHDQARGHAPGRDHHDDEAAQGRHHDADDPAEPPPARRSSRSATP